MFNTNGFNENIIKSMQVNNQQTANECAPDSRNTTDVKLITYFGLDKKLVISPNLEKEWTANT